MNWDAPFYLASLVLLSCLAAGCSQQEAGRPEPPSDSIKTVFHDAGVVNVGDAVLHTFVLENPDSLPATISAVTKDCSCIEESVDVGQVVPPNGKLEIRVSMATKGREGVAGTRLLVRTDNPRCPPVQFTIKCHVMRPVEYYPAEIDFGEVSPGSNPTRWLTIWDSRFENFEIGKIEHSGVALSTATERVLGDSSSGNRHGVKGWRITVELLNPASPGIEEGEVRIETTSNDLPVIVVPVRAQVLDSLYTSPPTIAFGVKNRKSVLRAFFFIKSRGGVSTEISDVHVDTEAITASAKLFSDTATPVSDRPSDVIGNGVVEIDVHAAPIGRPVRATVVIDTTNKDTPHLELPVMFMLQD